MLILMVVVADLAARIWVEAQVETSAERRLAGVAGVEAEVGSFPFLFNLAAGGEVTRFQLRLDEITGQELDVAILRLEIDDLRLDRSSLLRRGQARVTGVDRAAITAVITEDAVNAAVGLAGVDVRLRPGEVRVSAAGRTTTAQVTFGGGDMVVRAASLPPIVVPLPSSDLLPCAVDGEVLEGRLELSCVSDTLPAIVVDAIGSVDLRESAAKWGPRGEAEVGHV